MGVSWLPRRSGFRPEVMTVDGAPVVAVRLASESGAKATERARSRAISAGAGVPRPEADVSDGVDRAAQRYLARGRWRRE